MDPYAELPYPGKPYARTHPDHLSALARLHGLEPADPDGCRVLELACGDGLNVIAMAAAVPGMRVTGVDADAGAIARGQAVADALGIAERVELHVADLLDPLALEPAEYVICHGLYTWVPPRVADAALAAAAAHLAPGGVGFLSFNLMPGWRVRRFLGPALARRAQGSLDEQVAVARELLGSLGPVLEGRDDPYGRLLADEGGRLSETTDALLAHDDLAPGTTAAWHGDVVAHLDHHGLKVLCDAHPDALRAGPVADQELADIVWGPPYREIALIHAAVQAAPQPAGELPARPRRHALEPGERPLAFALARLQAREGQDVTTLEHRRLTIRDEAGRAILAHCDGTRDRAALARDAAAALGDPALEERMAALMDTALGRLAENALLLDGLPSEA